MEHTIESECTGVHTPARIVSPELISQRKTAEVAAAAVAAKEKNECALRW